MDFSLEMKQEVEQAGRCLSSERNRQYERMYERLLYQQGKGHDEARKLHRWLQECLAEVLRFPHDPDVPFDNNTDEDSALSFNRKVRYLSYRMRQEG
ncbi:hypothetical protein GGQ77_000363 [Geobacillus thermodenitrificans]|jgi:hypothetical protein|nr:hypothetical protein [Geobacillus thermodenitrificans]MED0661757.1 hypothetical protein [Geobacillus thermodenitrificans]